jgi:hypothetical protein
MRPGHGETLFLFGEDEVDVASQAHHWQGDCLLGATVEASYDKRANAAVLESDLGDHTIIALAEAGKRFADRPPRFLKHRPTAQYRYWIATTAREMLTEYVSYRTL